VNAIDKLRASVTRWNRRRTCKLCNGHGYLCVGGGLEAHAPVPGTTCDAYADARIPCQCSTQETRKGN